MLLQRDACLPACRGKAQFPVERLLYARDGASESELHSQLSGGRDEAVYDGLRVLRLRKNAVVLLCYKRHAMVFKPLIDIIVIESV